VTAVGAVGIIVGIVPLAEFIAVVASARFAAWFLPLVRSILPMPVSVAVVLIVVTGVADLTFGIGVLAGR
jgi:hypothetical protein